MKKKLFLTGILISMMIFSAVAIYAGVDEAAARKQPAAANFMPEAFTEIQTAMAVSVSGVRKQDANYLKGLSAYIRHVNRNVSQQEADEMVKSFMKYADRYDVDEKIVMAVAQTESCYYADVVSCANYKGLMQTGDVLAEACGYDPERLFEPEISIHVGASYIRDKLDEFGDTRLALTAYNQGSGSVHSGNYSTGYADLTMERANAMERFLKEKGYI